MAGNRLHFEEAIQKANDFVWAEEWNAAVESYRVALTEYPDDDSALMGYAWALLNVDDRDAALQVYERLTELVPDDPGPYERIAEILEHKHDGHRAAETYLEAAARYARQGVVAKQTSAIESALLLRPRKRTPGPAPGTLPSPEPRAPRRAGRPLALLPLPRRASRPGDPALSRNADDRARRPTTRPDADAAAKQSPDPTAPGSRFRSGSDAEAELT